MGNVVALRSAQNKKQPTLPELVARARALADDSWNVLLDQHVTLRMEQRGKTMRDILETLKKGEGVRGPDRDERGGYQIKLRRCVCGKRTQIVVVVRDADLMVVAIA
jgi:hypothetical protein